MKTPKRKYELNSEYDVIVIGSGISGLAVASILARNSKRVLLLEQHYKLGGFTHSFSRKQYEWDVGLHYVGELGLKDRFVSRLFSYLSGGRLTWVDMGEVYDRVCLADEFFDIHRGRQAFLEKMTSYFPNHADRLERYLRLIESARRASADHFKRQTFLPAWANGVVKKYTNSEFGLYASKTTSDAISSIISDPKLQAVLAAQWGDYGLPPSRSSFAMHAMLVSHYLEGASYPLGGSAKIAEAFCEELEAHGAHIKTGAQVESIHIENNIVKGVFLRGGSYIRSPKVVSTIGLRSSLQHLISPEYLKLESMRQELAHLSPSTSHVCLYLGLNASPEQLALPKANLWIHPDIDYEARYLKFLSSSVFEFPFYFISFPAAKDPLWSENRKNASTIEVIAPARLDWFGDWQSTSWKRRGPSYEALKEDISDELETTLLEKFPHLAGFLDYRELSTPLSTMHFNQNLNGEIYGLAHDPSRFSSKYLSFKSPISGLYFSGQDMLSAGVVGSFMSGFLAACSLLGPIKSSDFIRRVNAA